MEYNLETRTKLFAMRVRKWINQLPKSITTNEDCKQLTRSSGSIGANYLEANESLSKKDFQMRIKIAKKEAKESVFWIDLLEQKNANLEEERLLLSQECHELMNILGAILRNSQWSILTFLISYFLFVSSFLFLASYLQRHQFPHKMCR